MKDVVEYFINVNIDNIGAIFLLENTLVPQRTKHLGLFPAQDVHFGRIIWYKAEITFFGIKPLLL